MIVYSQQDIENFRAEIEKRASGADENRAKITTAITNSSTSTTEDSETPQEQTQTPNSWACLPVNHYKTLVW